MYAENDTGAPLLGGDGRGRATEYNARPNQVADRATSASGGMGRGGPRSAVGGRGPERGYDTISYSNRGAVSIGRKGDTPARATGSAIGSGGNWGREAEGNDDAAARGRTPLYNYADSESDGDDEVACDILRDPPACIRVPTIEKDKAEQYVEGSAQSLKPVDVYLEHCRKFARSSIAQKDLLVPHYKFGARDFTNQTLNMLLIDKMLKDGAYFGSNEFTDEEKSECFQTDGMRVFTDFFHHDGALYMLVKTWQKITFQTKDQRRFVGNVAEAAQRRHDIARQARQHGSEVTNPNSRLENLQRAANAGSTPNYEDLMKNQFYIKTFQVYNRYGEPIDDPILVEQVFGSFETYRLYDTSVLHRGRKLYYFKRLFIDEPVDEGKSYAMDGVSDGVATQSNDGSQLEPHVVDDQSERIVPQDQDNVSQQTRGRRAMRSVLAANRIKNASMGPKVSKIDLTRQARDRQLIRALERQKVRLQLFAYDVIDREESEVKDVFLDETEWPGSPDGDDDVAGAATPGSRPKPTRAHSVLSGIMTTQGGSRNSANESRPGMVDGKPLKDLAEKKPQYQVTFSVEFGQDSLEDSQNQEAYRSSSMPVSPAHLKKATTELWNSTGKYLGNKELEQEMKWLDQQYFVVQQYMRGKEHSNKQPALQPLRIFNIAGLKQDQNEPFVSTGPDRIEAFKGLLPESDSKVGVEVNRQVQFLNHITGSENSDVQTASHQQENQVHFLVSNMFVLVEIQCKRKEAGNEETVTGAKAIVRKNLDTFQKIWNNGGIVPQKHSVAIPTSDNEFNKIQQYYFVDSRNQIQLVYPNHDSKVETLKIIEVIAEEMNIQQKDFKYYKKINCISTLAPDRMTHPGAEKTESLAMTESDKKKNAASAPKLYYKQVVQRIDDLKRILDYENIQSSQSINFLHDEEIQLLTIQEPRSEKIVLFQMQDHNCNRCAENHDTAYQRRTIETSHQILQDKAQKGMDGILRQQEPCGGQVQQPGVAKDNMYGLKSSSQDLPSAFDQSRRKPTLCEMCGDEHEDAYTSYVDRGANQRAQLNQGNIITLAPEECNDHVFIDDFNGNKMKVRTHELIQSTNKPAQQVALLLYQQTSGASHVLFMFAVYNGEFEGSGTDDDSTNVLVRKNYIFVRKSRAEMVRIFQSMCDEVIVKADDHVLVMKHHKHVDLIKFSEIREYQFAEESNDDSLDEPNKFKDDIAPYRHMKLTLCKAADDKCQINFVPIIYQEKQTTQANQILVFDILQNRISQRLSIAPSVENQDYLFEDEHCYNKFMICRTSDLYEDALSGEKKEPNMQRAKYQLFTLYTEKIGRFMCEEFLIVHRRRGAIVQTIGQKHVLLSKTIIENCAWRNVSESQAIPFHDSYGSVKGCQIMLKTDDRSYTVIDLRDQDKNNIYTYKSSVILSGQKKFLVPGLMRERQGKQDDSYVLVISTMLRRRLILKNVLNRSEAFSVLKWSLDTMMSMRIPDLEYLALNSFEELKRTDFFRPQEILLGKSICDICLTEPQSIMKAFDDIKESYNRDTFQRAPGSLMEFITADDRIRRETFIQTGFYPKQLVISLDLNFQGTIRRALFSNCIKSLKMILDHVLQTIDDYGYRPVLLFDLRTILSTSQIQINTFFRISASEQSMAVLPNKPDAARGVVLPLEQNNSNKRYCNLEIEFKDPDLPVLGDAAFAHFTINSFENFMNPERDILASIKHFNPLGSSSGGADRVEVEYSYIDFTWMIIGEKIENLHRKKPVKFDDLYYSQLINLDEGSSKLAFFQQPSVQYIIDSQWQTTQEVQQIIFVIYLTLFCIPMCVSSFRISNEVDSLMFYIAMLPAIMLLFIEVVQMRFQGQMYLSSGWNNIDILQLIIFGILFYLRMNNVDSKALYYPELKLVNIALTFVKTLFFIRIYKRFSFLVQMIISCLGAITPFIIYYIVFLLVFSICFIILQMEVDGEVAEAQGLNLFSKIVLETFRTSIGELGMPMYSKILKREPSVFKYLNIVLIWITWVVQTFFMLIVMLNFLIAVITNNYENVFNKQIIYSYFHKAGLNHETCMLLSVLQDLPEYRCIVFQQSRNGENGPDEMDERFDGLRKFIAKQNKQILVKHEEIGEDMATVLTQQSDLQEQLKQGFMHLADAQMSAKEEILEQMRGGKKHISN